jgi:hypothetical protein
MIAKRITSVGKQLKAVTALACRNTLLLRESNSTGMEINTL